MQQPPAALNGLMVQSQGVVLQPQPAVPRGLLQSQQQSIPVRSAQPLVTSNLAASMARIASANPKPGLSKEIFLLTAPTMVTSITQANSYPEPIGSVLSPPVVYSLRHTARFLSQIGLGIVRDYQQKTATIQTNGSFKPPPFALPVYESTGINSAKRRKISSQPVMSTASFDLWSMWETGGMTLPLRHLLVPTEPQLNCVWCDLIVFSRFQLLMHYQSGHTTDTITFICAACPAGHTELRARVQFQRHMKECHPELSIILAPPNQVTAFPCPICPASGISLDDLPRHTQHCVQKWITANGPTSLLHPSRLHYNFVLWSSDLLAQNLHTSRVINTGGSAAMNRPLLPRPTRPMVHPVLRPPLPSVPLHQSPPAQLNMKLPIPRVVPSTVAKSGSVPCVTKMQCELCDAPLLDRTHLLKHMISSHLINLNQIRAVACPECSQPFLTNQGMTRHRRVHMGDNGEGRTCFMCQLPIPVNKLYDHYKTRHPKAYQDNLHGDTCLICQNTAGNPIADMTQHLKVAHGIVASLTSLINTTTSPPTAATLPPTNGNHSPKFQCRQCQKNFVTSGLLKDHIQNLHLSHHRPVLIQAKPKVESSSPGVTCPICPHPLNFPSEADRTQHLAAQHLRPCRIVLDRLSKLELEEVEI